jgi:hypothetical protein
MDQLLQRVSSVDAKTTLAIICVGSNNIQTAV